MSDQTGVKRALAIFFILLVIALPAFADTGAIIYDNSPGIHDNDPCWKLAENNYCPHGNKTLENLITINRANCEANYHKLSCNQFIEKFKDKYGGHAMNCGSPRMICQQGTDENFSQGCRQYGIELKSDFSLMMKKVKSCLLDPSCLRSVYKEQLLLGIMPDYVLGGAAASVIREIPKEVRDGIDKYRRLSCLDAITQAKLKCYVAVQVDAAVLTAPLGGLSGDAALAILGRGAMADIPAVEADLLADVAAQARAKTAPVTARGSVETFATEPKLTLKQKISAKVKSSKMNPADGLTPSLSPADRAAYKNFYHQVTAAIDRNMRDNAVEVLEAIDRKDPYIGYLRSLGYTVERRGSELNLKVPPFGQQMKRLNGRVDDLIKSGVIPNGAELRPGKIYWYIDPKTHANEIAAVAFDAPVPAGYQAYKGVLSDEDYAKVVASGYLPIGDAHIGVNGISMAAHDLAHFFGVVEHPEFMKAFRQTYANL